MDSALLGSEIAGVHNKSSKTPKKDDGSKIAFDRTKKEHGRRFKKKPKGVIYISHIPHGFYEDQMREYFSQFGKVKATSVSRSKKTGRSKGYGFVEFDDEEVAKIAAESMNNYLMYNKIVKCRYIPPEERKGKIFFKPYIAGDYARKKNRMIDSTNKAKAFSNLDQTIYLKKTQSKINKFKKFFEERGIEFNFKILPENPPDDHAIKKRIRNSASESSLISNNEASDEFGVLEIDESDQEISFRTPPQVKKVLKKSLNSCTSTSTKLNSENSPAGKKGKLMNLNSSNVKRSKGGKRKKRNEKDNKRLLAKSSDLNKLKPSKNEISTSVKQKKPKIIKKQ